MTTRIVFLLGGPASGKGTFCARLAAAYPGRVTSVCPGALLREQTDPAIVETLRDGRIVPASVTVPLLQTAMDAWLSTEAQRDASKCILIDGFPRTVEQAQAFEETVGRPDGLLWLDVNEAEMDRRRSERLGKDTLQGTVRSDDNAASFAKRLETYRKSTWPVLERYRADAGLVFCAVVDAAGPPDVVYRAAAAPVEDLLA